MNYNNVNRRHHRRSNAPDTAHASNVTAKPSVNTNDEALAELASCCICFDAYNRSSRAPILIPCGHTFCRECADKIVTEDAFFCCNCRTVSLLGFGGLSKNADLIQLLETLGLLDEEEAPQRPPAKTVNKVTNEVYHAVPLATFGDYCRSFFNLATRYLEFRLGARTVLSNQTVIQKVREAIDGITAALPSLQCSIKKLVDAPLNPSGVPSIESWDDFYRPRLNAMEAIEYPVFLPARNGSSGATSSASSSTSSSTSAPRRNRPKKKRNPAPIPQRRTIDWDVTPSHLNF